MEEFLWKLAMDNVNTSDFAMVYNINEGMPKTTKKDTCVNC